MPDKVPFFTLRNVSIAEGPFGFAVIGNPLLLVETTMCSYVAWALTHKLALGPSSVVAVQMSVVPNTIMTAP